MAKKPKVQSAIVGSGYAASFHFEAIHRVPHADVEVAGVYSATPANAQRFAKARDIRAFDSLEALLDQDLDVVHVCAPPTVHEAIAVAALERGINAIVEKPLTGYFGDGDDGFDGRQASMETALAGAVASLERMLAAEAASPGRILYAKNWVYAPAIQKEREIIEKTGAQILWQHGEEAHSGSHSQTYGFWHLVGGGAMIGKACHPLTGALYLKRVEGRARDGEPIRPVGVCGRTHSLTQLQNFRDEGHLRADYHDIEDFSGMHVVFEDGTIADIFASDIVMGGTHNWLEVVCNNHRSVCNINPTTAMQTYNPVDAAFQDIYVVEKTGTKQGWSSPAPDEDHTTGFPQEMEAFYRAVTEGETPESDSSLAADCIATIYAAYLSAERAGTEVAVPKL
jgi:predicted dehydrogenase